MRVGSERPERPTTNPTVVTMMLIAATTIASVHAQPLRSKNPIPATRERNPGRSHSPPMPYHNAEKEPIRADNTPTSRIAAPPTRTTIPTRICQNPRTVTPVGLGGFCIAGFSTTGQRISLERVSFERWL